MVVGVRLVPVCGGGKVQFDFQNYAAYFVNGILTQLWRALSVAFPVILVTARRGATAYLHHRGTHGRHLYEAYAALYRTPLHGPLQEGA